ncbi:unnamed protein product [Hyaloperonospora brassicae]|uniref:Uncharacterized protein n=1 Tax=Hyaloperonospora brassicae TaxID=162125 RepID=A0AAV0U081_HYABA|nr:unnamed protein product [Hyaloperonospora brassicae]
MTPIRESEDGTSSSGDNVATEGEEEDDEEQREELTPYVAKCYGHLETLRKRKREQEERVETLVEETFGQIETIMQEIMRGLQERHAVSHAHFEATESQTLPQPAGTQSGFVQHLCAQKKLKLIASILLREDTDE